MTKEWVVIHDRPDNLCGDFVPMNKIIDNDINRCESEHYFQTHSINPLLKENTIREAVDKYFDNLDQYDALFSVNKLQVRLFNEDLEPLNHKFGELLRTQDLGLPIEG